MTITENAKSISVLSLKDLNDACKKALDELNSSFLNGNKNLFKHKLSDAFIAFFYSLKEYKDKDYKRCKIILNYFPETMFRVVLPYDLQDYAIKRIKNRKRRYSFVNGKNLSVLYNWSVIDLYKHLSAMERPSDKMIEFFIEVFFNSLYEDVFNKLELKHFEKRLRERDIKNIIK